MALKREHLSLQLPIQQVAFNFDFHIRFYFTIEKTTFHIDFLYRTSNSFQHSQPANMLFSRLSFGLFAAAAIATPMPSEHSIEKRDLTSDILYIHNHYRAAHHVGNLVWNADLATYAAQNANKCVFQHTVRPSFSISIFHLHLSLFFPFCDHLKCVCVYIFTDLFSPRSSPAASTARISPRASPILRQLPRHGEMSRPNTTTRASSLRTLATSRRWCGRPRPGWDVLRRLVGVQARILSASTTRAAISLANSRRTYSHSKGYD